jgi:hypothetical protein
MTLLELLVVLVVLVALAGIVIPLLPNVIGRAAVAVGATNASEVDRIVQTYQQMTTFYPDYLDNLVGTSAPLDYIPGASLGQITLGNLSAAQATALNNAGLTTVATLYGTQALLTTNQGTPTFNPYQYTTSTTSTTTSTNPVATQPIASGLAVAFLTSQAVENPPGIVRVTPSTSGGIYVVFGFGKQTTAIGSVMTDAPVHFSQFAADQATYMYCRYGLVFRLAQGNGTSTPTPLTTAAFVGAVSFEPTGIMGSDGQLANYYDNIMIQK